MNLITKLRKIERLQNQVKDLLREIESEHPSLANSDEDGWSFSMHVDANGSLMSAVESFELAQKFMREGGVQS